MGERGDGKGFTSLFGPLDETERGTIFDGPSRVHELCLAENFASRLVRERVDANLSSQRFLVSARENSRQAANGLTRGVLPIAPTKPLTGSP